MSERGRHVAVIIVNWHDWPNTVAAASSVLASSSAADTAGLQVTVVVVDNEAAEAAPSLPSGVHLIRSAENLGYAGGNNLGIAHALAWDAPPDYFLILNNDARVAPDAISQLVSYQQAHPEVGATAPVLTDASGRHAASGGQWGRLYLHRFTEAPAAPRRVDFAIGAALLIPRGVMERLDGFDERFFHYGEDLDLCWRLGQEHLAVVVVPLARVVHVGRNSLGRRPDQLTYYVVRNAVLFARKHGLAAPVGWLAIAAQLVPVRSLLRGRRTTLRAAWRGLWDGITGISGRRDIDLP